MSALHKTKARGRCQGRTAAARPSAAPRTVPPPKPHLFPPVSLKNRGVSHFLAGKQSAKREGSAVRALAAVTELQISPFHLHVATSKSPPPTPAREIFASVGLARARGWTEVFGVECYSLCELGTCHAVRRHPAPGPAAKLCHGNPAAQPGGLGGSPWVKAIKLLLQSWFEAGSIPLPWHGLFPARPVPLVTHLSPFNPP